jgi:hypothetical protein
MNHPRGLSGLELPMPEPCDEVVDWVPTADIDVDSEVLCGGYPVFEDGKCEKHTKCKECGYSGDSA